MRRTGFRFAESGGDRFLSAHLSNSQYNRLVWGVYPLLRRVGSLAGVSKPREAEADRVLGEEWGTRAWVDEILEQFLFPYVFEESIVGEIGVGGGRIAARVARRVGMLYCFDLSAGMLGKARAALAGFDNTRFVLLKRPTCPPNLLASLDFVYAFDVFVHFDLHTTWEHVRLMRDMLKPGGKALVHVANLKAPLGWERFSQQKGFSVGGLYWLSPEMVAILADRAGFSLVSGSTPDPSNEYLNRDYFAVLEKHIG